MAQNFRRQAITRSIPKSENIRKTYRQTISSFGGIRTSATPIEMSPNIFSDAKNVYVTEDNCLATRKRLHFLNQASSDKTVVKSVEFDGFMVLILDDNSLAYFKIEDTAPSTLTTISGVTATADSGLYRVPGAVYVTHSTYNNSASTLELVKIINDGGELKANSFPNSDTVYTPSPAVSDGKIFHDSLRDDRLLLNVLTPNFYNGTENLKPYEESNPTIPKDFINNAAQDYMVDTGDVDSGNGIPKSNQYYYREALPYNGGKREYFYRNNDTSATKFSLNFYSGKLLGSKTWNISVEIDGKSALRRGYVNVLGQPSLDPIEIRGITILNSTTIMFCSVMKQLQLENQPNSFSWYIASLHNGEIKFVATNDDVQDSKTPLFLARCLGLSPDASVNYKQLDKIFYSIDNGGYTCLYYNVFGKYTAGTEYHCYDEIEMTKFKLEPFTASSVNYMYLTVSTRDDNYYTAADYIHKINQSEENYGKDGLAPWDDNPKITTFTALSYTSLGVTRVSINIGYAMPDDLYANGNNGYIRRTGETSPLNNEWLLVQFDYPVGQDWANVSGNTDYDKFANVFHPTSLEGTGTFYTMIDGLCSIGYTNNSSGTLYFWRFGQRANGSTCFGSYSSPTFTTLADITFTRSSWVAKNQYIVSTYDDDDYTAFVTYCNAESMHVLIIGPVGETTHTSGIYHNSVYSAPTNFVNSIYGPAEDQEIVEDGSDDNLYITTGNKYLNILVDSDSWETHYANIREKKDITTFGDLDALTMWSEARRKLSTVNGVYAMNNFIVFALQNGFAYSASFDDSYVRIGNIETTWTGSKPIDEMITISPSAAIAFTKQASYWILGDGEANLTNVKPVMSQFVVNDVRHNCAVKLALSDTPTVLSDRGVMSFTGSSEVTETASNINELTEIIREKFNEVYGTSPAETYTFRGPWYNLFCINSQIAGTMSKVLFYDMRTSTWWYWEFPVLMKNFYTFKNVLYGIDINTNIYKLVDDLIKTDETAAFYDTLNGSDEKIRWYIISQPSSFGTPALAKTLVSSTFALTPRLEIGARSNDRLDVTDDTVEGADLYVNFIPRAYDRPGVRETAAASGHDIIHQLSTMYMRTYIPKFNYLSYEFNNLGYDEDDSIVARDYTTQCDKLELASVTFAYKMVNKLG